MVVSPVCLFVAPTASHFAVLARLVQSRRGAGLYPEELDFRTAFDPRCGRAGSGGGLLHALCALGLAQDRLPTPLLVIQAGGECRPLPCYAPETALFAPVPLASSSPVQPVLLDALLSVFLRYPWQQDEVVVASGDVLVDFDEQALPHDRGDVCGFVAPASFEEGSHHGVFRVDRNRQHVVDFYQKGTPAFLRENAALSGTALCGLDTGVVSFGRKGVVALRTLAGSRLPSGATVLDEISAGRLALDLYLEIFTACVKGIPWETYFDRVGSQSPAPRHTLELVHDCFRAVDLRAVVTQHARFLHFGTLERYLASCARVAADSIPAFYQKDDGELKPAVGPGVILNASCGVSLRTLAPSTWLYAESCVNVALETAGGTNLLFGLEDCRVSGTLPAGMCLDRRLTAKGTFVLAYAVGDSWRIQDSPEAITFCAVSLPKWLAARGLKLEDILSLSEPADLYRCRLFCPVDDLSFARGYWDVSVVDHSWTERFLSSERATMAEVNDATDVLDRDRRRQEIRARLLREQILRGEGWRSISEKDFCRILGSDDVPALRSILERTDDDLLAIYRRKLFLALAGGERSDSIVSLGLQYVETGSRSPLQRGVKLDQIVWARCPIRLDLAGGWTDTPPYTLREGGGVVNVAANLNHQPPIQVFCRPVPELTLRIHSIDLGVTEAVDGFPLLEDFASPRSPFALPKAALCLLGLTKQATGAATLEEALSRVGCGLEITLLCAVPKGSGLGTSSILGGTILGALRRFFSLPIVPGNLFREVLQMEQMLTTGGGWQDQIGGLLGGVKHITSAPGLKPNPLVYQLDPYLFTDQERLRCFTLFYTGITRLAKNILQEVIDQSNAMSAAYLFTLRSLKQLAHEAREAVSLRDAARLARVLNGSWHANKLIHHSTTNDEVDELLSGVTGLYAGMKLLGAGGGGYALFLSESPARADELRSRLSTRYEDDRARVVDLSLNQTGLEVTVS